jgi:outer membrane protein, heavy metal efflux system
VGPAVLALAACVRYVPQPIAPAVHASEYRARRLDDSGLVNWVTRWAGRPEPRRWSDRQLAVAALGLRAELARARAEWRATLAGERSAGARPQPGVGIDVERAVAGSEGQSPWVVSLAGLFAVELGGKRGARLQRARARTAAAEGELRLSAWRIVRGARTAATAVMVAESDLAYARREAAALAGVQTLEQARYQEASLTSAELARTSSEVQGVLAQVSAAEAAVLEARAALAGALAVPARALDSVAVAPDSTEGCHVLQSMGTDSLAALALTRRPEIGRALAEYASAEADVRLEVSKQYPDLDLGPGFIWDQGVQRWTLALTLPNLLGFRNRAAVREAYAARAAAAARVAEAQDALLAEVELAAGRCRGAVLERAAADSQVTAAERATELARRSFQRGETSRLEPSLADLAVARAERERSSAAARVMAAGQGLGAAAGIWAASERASWPDPRRDELTEDAPK